MQDHPSLLDELRDMDAEAAARRLATLPDAKIAELLHAIGPGRALAVLDRFGPERRTRIAFAAGEDTGEQWLAGLAARSLPIAGSATLTTKKAAIGRNAPVKSVNNAAVLSGGGSADAVASDGRALSVTVCSFQIPGHDQ